MRWILLSVSLLFVISGYAFLFTGLSRQFQLQSDINDKLPQSQKFEPVFWSFGTWQRFRSLEAKLLPDNARSENIRMISVLGVIQLLLGILLGAKALFH